MMHVHVKHRGSSAVAAGQQDTLLLIPVIHLKYARLGPKVGLESDYRPPACKATL